MELFLLLASLLLPHPAAAQSTVAAQRPPLTEDDAKAVLAPIDALFAAFEAGDASAMLRQVYPDGRVTATGTRGDGTSNLRQQGWTQFADRIKPERSFQER